MRSMASCLRDGSGGWKLMLPFFSTPSGTVTSAASAAVSQNLLVVSMAMKHKPELLSLCSHPPPVMRRNTLPQRAFHIPLRALLKRVQ